MTGVRNTAFFEVTSTTNKYTVRDVTDIYLPYLDPQVLVGDVNDDNTVSIADVTALIDYLLSGNTTINADAADVNDDNNVTIADVTALIDYLLSGSW